MFSPKLFRKMVFIVCLGCSLPLLSRPDVTIVGYLAPGNGLGTVPINILETLGEGVSANIIATRLTNYANQKTPHVMSALSNNDKSSGKIAILTDALWHIGGNSASYVPKDSIIKLAYSMFETTRIPSKWVEILNTEFDAVVVPDTFLVKVYKSSGVQIPIFVLPIPMMLDPYYERPVHPIVPSTPFVFGDASANKNPYLLIEAFAKAFGNNHDVHLVLRAPCFFGETKEKINTLINKYSLTNVTIEEAFFGAEEYINRLASFDCYVNLSRGEGFSFIHREALALGIPVIATNNTVLKTICDSGFVRAVSSNIKGSPFPIYTFLFPNEDCGKQFDCEVDEAAKALLDVYHHYPKYIKKARKGRKWVDQYNCTNLNLQKSYHTIVKPRRVVLSEKNAIEDGVLFTTSTQLCDKYRKVID